MPPSSHHNTHAHTYKRARARAHTRTHTRKHIRTHTRTHKHTYTCIQERKEEMLLRSLGKSERGGQGSLYYVDVEVTDLIPKSGVRLTRASGRMIFEVFDDLVPNVARLFADMVELLAVGHAVYECGNNEMGFRCVWNKLDRKLDEAAMAVRSFVRSFVLSFVRSFVFDDVALLLLLLLLGDDDEDDDDDDR